MTDVGRDLCRSSGPIYLLKQGRLEQITLHSDQTYFEYLQEGIFHFMDKLQLCSLLILIPGELFLWHILTLVFSGHSYNSARTLFSFFLNI